MEIKVGDKVRRRLDPTRTGVVTGIATDSRYIYVLQDKRYRDGSNLWLLSACEVYESAEPVEPVAEEKPSHIAGLSPEAIDPDAYRAFMDAL